MSKVRVVLSNRTREDIDKSTELVDYLRRNFIPFDSSRLEDYPEAGSPGEVGAFTLAGTFVAYENIVVRHRVNPLDLRGSPREKSHEERLVDFMLAYGW